MSKCLTDQRKLSMRQRSWIKFMKDYDFELKYHLNKANKVADTLSRQEMHTSELMMLEHNLLERF